MKSSRITPWLLGAYDSQERMGCMEDLRLGRDRCSRRIFPFLQESK